MNANRRCLLITALCGALLLPAIVYSQSPLPAMSDIEQVWRTRQDSAKTIRVDWKEKHLIPKGGYSTLVSFANPNVPDPTPASDYAYVSERSLVIAAENMVTRHDNHSWKSDKRAFFPKPTHNYFSEQIVTVCFPKSEFHAFPLVVKNSANHTYGWPAWMLPIGLTVRGCSRRVCERLLEDYKISGRQEVVNGVPCMEVRRKASIQVTESLWLAPSMDYVVVRAVVAGPEGIDLKIDANYARVEGHWMPKSWTTIRAFRGRIVDSWTSIIENLEVNSPVAKEEFQCDEQGGSRVVDGSGAKEKNYIVRDDHSKRVMGHGDFGKTYEEILNSDPPQSSGTRFRIGSMWLALALAALLLVLVA